MTILYYDPRELDKVLTAFARLDPRTRGGGYEEASNEPNYRLLYPRDKPTEVRKTMSKQWTHSKTNGARKNSLNCIRAAEANADAADGQVLDAVLEGKRLIDIADGVTAVPSLSSDDISAYGFVDRTTGELVESTANLRRQVQTALAARAGNQPRAPANANEDDAAEAAGVGAGAGAGVGGGDGSFATPSTRPAGRRRGIFGSSGSSSTGTGSSGSGRHRLQASLGRVAPRRRGRRGRGTPPPSAASSSGYNGEDEGNIRRDDVARNVQDELDDEDDEFDDDDEEDAAVLLDGDDGDEGEIANGNRNRASPPGSAHRSIARGTVQMPSSGRRPTPRRDPPGSSMMEAEGSPLGVGYGAGIGAGIGAGNGLAMNGLAMNGLARVGPRRGSGGGGISNQDDRAGGVVANASGVGPGAGIAGTGAGDGTERPLTLDEAIVVIGDLRGKLSEAKKVNKKLLRLVHTAQGGDENFQTANNTEDDVFALAMEISSGTSGFIEHAFAFLTVLSFVGLCLWLWFAPLEQKRQMQFLLVQLFDPLVGVFVGLEKSEGVGHFLSGP